MLQVRIQLHHHVAARGLQARAQRRLLAEVARQLHQPQRRLHARPLRHALGRVVGAAVVHHDDLPALHQPRQRLGQQRQQQAEVACLVTPRDHARHGRRTVPAHRRTRRIRRPTGSGPGRCGGGPGHGGQAGRLGVGAGRSEHGGAHLSGVDRACEAQSRHGQDAAAVWSRKLKTHLSLRQSAVSCGGPQMSASPHRRIAASPDLRTAEPAMPAVLRAHAAPLHNRIPRGAHEQGFHQGDRRRRGRR